MNTIEWTTRLAGRDYRDPVATAYIPDRMPGCTVPAHLVLAAHGREFQPQNMFYTGRHKARRAE